MPGLNEPNPLDNVYHLARVAREGSPETDTTNMPGDMLSSEPDGDFYYVESTSPYEHITAAKWMLARIEAFRHQLRYEIYFYMALACVCLAIIITSVYHYYMAFSATAAFAAFLPSVCLIAAVCLARVCYQTWCLSAIRHATSGIFERQLALITDAQDSIERSYVEAR